MEVSSGWPIRSLSVHASPRTGLVTGPHGRESKPSRRGEGMRESDALHGQYAQHIERQRPSRRAMWPALTLRSRQCRHPRAA